MTVQHRTDDERAPQSALPASSEAGNVTLTKACGERQTGAPVPRVILVAEDDEEIREVMVMVLCQDGYDVISVGTATDAVKILKGMTVDLVVTDIRMPGGSGRQVLAAARESLHSPPVVIITGALEPDITREFAAAGAAGCLHKPFSITDLQRTVHQQMGH